MLPLSDREVPRHGTPYVNIAIIVVNVLVFIYTFTLSGLDEQVFFLRFGVLPIEFTSGISVGIQSLPGGGTVDLTSPVPTWATLVTSMFIHGGFMHVGGNMLFLWVFGDNIEEKLGHVGYAIFYVGAGLAAGAAHIAFSWDSVVPTVGASGAVAGVLGAYLMYYAFHRIHTLIFLGFFIMVQEIPAVLMIGYWAFMQVFSGVASIGASGGGVAYWAHVGGFVAGVGFVAATRLARGQPIWQPDHRMGAHRYYR